MEALVTFFLIEKRDELYIRALIALAKIQKRLGDVQTSLAVLQKAEKVLYQQGQNFPDTHLLQDKIAEMKRENVQ